MRVHPGCQCRCESVAGVVRVHVGVRHLKAESVARVVRVHLGGRSRGKSALRVVRVYAGRPPHIHSSHPRNTLRFWKAYLRPNDIQNPGISTDHKKVPSAAHRHFLTTLAFSAGLKACFLPGSKLARSSQLMPNPRQAPDLTSAGTLAGVSRDFG